MKVKWVRGNHTFRFTRPDVWFDIGKRGAGKSSFLEYLATKYLDEGAVVCDLFGSRDGEGLAWLRSPYAKEKKILLLKGDNVDVKSSWDVKNVTSLKVKDFEEYDIIINSSPLYTSFDQEFFYAAKITDLLYSRMHPKRLVYGICREASNFYYSRLKVCESQTFAKANMIYLIRESRHVWLALGLDSIRYYAIDIDIRTLADFMIIKAQGLQGLTKDLKWLYSRVEPHLVRKLKPHQFLILTDDGAIGYGVFPEIEWHKREKEDIMRAVGVTPEYGEELKESEYRGTFKTVSDEEHAAIIRIYVEQGIGLTKIANQLNRSSKTILDHKKHHNDAVKRSGFCPACKRYGSEYQDKMVSRGYAK